MRHALPHAALIAALLALAPGAPAQDEARIVRLDDFESDLAGWSALKIEDGAGPAADDGSRLAIVRDAQHVRQGRGALSYAYELSPAAMRVLSIQHPKDFTGAKTLRFWVKCSSATAFLVGLTETGGAAYQTPFYCPAGTWQEVALNLDELAPDDPSKDSNGTLDLDEIEHFTLMDMGGILVRMLPDIAGPRLLWLDDVGFSSRPAPRTTGETKSPSGAPVHLVDNFESPVIRWSPVSIELVDTPRINIFDSPLAVDAGAPADGGRQSLKMTYVRQAGKIQGLMRSLEKADLRKAKGLDLSLKTSRDGTFLLCIEEKDGSRYQQILELKAGEGWKALSRPLAGFAKADDSQDENGKLDADQIKEISLSDFTTLFSGGAGAGKENVLQVDEVRFTLGE